MYEELIMRLLEDKSWIEQGTTETEHEIADHLQKAVNAIEKLSKERKAGKWCADYDYAEYDFDGSTPLTVPLKFQDGWQCSFCGVYSSSETNYCPNCGADMRGEQDG